MGFRGAFGNVNRWFTTVVNQPNAKAVLGEVVLCTKEAQFDAKKFAEFSGKGDKKKEEKPKKEQPAKKEPEKKKEKPAEKAEEEDDGMPKEPNSKDPLAALPKGTFDLEEWKRFYSNNDEDDSIKWFWEHFDAEHYSIWRSDYKFNNELTMVFMSCNLVGGMFQRLEKITTPASQASGYGRAKNLHLTFARIGLSTLVVTTGRSLIPSRRNARPLSPSTGSGRVLTWKVASSTRARF